MLDIVFQVLGAAVMALRIAAPVIGAFALIHYGDIRSKEKRGISYFQFVMLFLCAICLFLLAEENFEECFPSLTFSFQTIVSAVFLILCTITAIRVLIDLLHREK